MARSRRHLLAGRNGKEVRVLLGPLAEVQLLAGRLEGAVQSELGVDTIDPVRRVDVLHQHDLEAGGGTLARGDGRPGQEKRPDLIEYLLANSYRFLSRGGGGHLWSSGRPMP